MPMRSWQRRCRSRGGGGANGDIEAVGATPCCMQGIWSCCGGNWGVGCESGCHLPAYFNWSFHGRIVGWFSFGEDRHTISSFFFSWHNVFLQKYVKIQVLLFFLTTRSRNITTSKRDYLLFFNFLLFLAKLKRRFIGRHTNNGAPLLSQKIEIFCAHTFPCHITYRCTNTIGALHIGASWVI
jgi:hypothetical protein